MFLSVYCQTTQMTHGICLDQNDLLQNTKIPRDAEKKTAHVKMTDGIIDTGATRAAFFTRAIASWKNGNFAPLWGDPADASPPQPGRGPSFVALNHLENTESYR